MSNLVSIVMPVYNVRPFLEQSMMSVLQQTYENIEVIVIDDGSTDGGGKICDGFAEKDHRVHVYHKENEGVAQARNDGLKHVKGDYVMFVDPDDMVHPELVSYLIKMFERDDIEVACTNYTRVTEYPENHVLYDGAKVKMKTSYYTGMEMLNEIYTNTKEILLSVVWGKLYSRKVIEGLSFPQGRIHEDEYFTYKALHNTQKMAYLDLPLYYYLVREGSITSTITRKNVEDTIEALKERIEFCKTEGLDVLTHKSIGSLINSLIQLYIYVEPNERSSVKNEVNKLISDNKESIVRYPLIKKIRIKVFQLSPALYFGIYKLLGKEYK